MTAEAASKPQQMLLTKQAPRVGAIAFLVNGNLCEAPRDAHSELLCLLPTERRTDVDRCAVNPCSVETLQERLPGKVWKQLGHHSTRLVNGVEDWEPIEIEAHWVFHSAKCIL